MDIKDELELGTGTGVALNLPIAGAGSRAYAFLIDWHIRVGVVLLWLLLFFGLSFTLDFYDDMDQNSFILWTAVPSTLFYLLYHPVMELVMQGDSVGKRYAGIHCIDAQGNPPSSGAILLRNIMRIVDSLPVFYTLGTTVMIFSERQQRLGDMVAGTLVVVADTNSDEALQQLKRVEQAQVPAQEAELIVEILDRWDSLQSDKRRNFALTLFSRLEIEPAAGESEMRTQLEGLLGR